MKITALYFYPVKSLRGIRTDTLALDSAGPRFDREWMVVGSDGKFLTQREFPKMQLVETALGDEALTLTAPGLGALQIPLAAEGRRARRVQVWNTEVDALDEGEAAARFFTEYLGRPAALVRIGPAGRQENAQGIDYGVRFADACPLLVCSEESLRDLRARAGQDLSAERFRPNLVVAGAPAFAEDKWAGFFVNNLHFKSIRACTRCAITTLDPVTAARGPEPLKTLATYRRQGNKVAFGQYFFSVPGELRVGMEIQPEDA